MDDVISRQAAIDALHMHLMYRMGTDSNKKRLDEWINNLPSAQPDLDEWCPDCKEYDSKRHCCPRLNRVIRGALKEVQTEKKKGKWIEKEYSPFYCSVCGTYQYSASWEIKNKEYNFCPRCGADMRGEDNG